MFSGQGDRCYGIWQTAQQRFKISYSGGFQSGHIKHFSTGCPSYIDYIYTFVQFIVSWSKRLQGMVRTHARKRNCDTQGDFF